MARIGRNIAARSVSCSPELGAATQMNVGSGKGQKEATVMELCELGLGIGLLTAFLTISFLVKLRIERLFVTAAITGFV